MMEDPLEAMSCFWSAGYPVSVKEGDRSGSYFLRILKK